MNSFECAAECGNRNELTRECIWVKNYHLPCSYGVFATICHEHIKADYKIREFSDGVLKATIQGKSGIVEVWGGFHAKEVWVIERGTKKETLITDYWCVKTRPDAYSKNLMLLDEALERAYSLAGVQTKLVI